MIVLGIDPGSRVSGYAILEIKNLKIKYLRSGIVKINTTGNFPNRLHLIYQEFKQIFDSINISHVAIESLIHVKNVSSLAKLAQARGAILSAISEKIEIVEYAPNKIKSSVSGFGHADKLMIHQAIERILGQKIKCQTHDESDALAVALTHCISITSGGIISRPNKLDIFSRKNGSIAASINPSKLKL